MRVLLAFDGSPGAGMAVDLVRNIAWPEGSALRLVHVDGSLPAPIADVARTLEHAGRNVEHCVIRRGSAADVIVEDAQRWRADLLVAGSRGHGPFTTALSGSAAVHLAEHAPCPVLIARVPSWNRFLFAEDGSEAAYAARRLLATSPIFKGRRVHVVSVAQVREPLLSGIVASVRDEAKAARRETELEARAAYGRLAVESADQLRIAGLAADSEARDGDPAEQIVVTAHKTSADAIVIGTRGRGDMTRALLGSVARAVLLTAPCSVLVVRGR